MKLQILVAASALFSVTLAAPVEPDTSINNLTVLTNPGADAPRYCKPEYDPCLIDLDCCGCWCYNSLLWGRICGGYRHEPVEGCDIVPPDLANPNGDSPDTTDPDQASPSGR